ncbi:hypothetical protein [uncultured Tenacibaculum sp.]|uniref:hypothetical protein n=1 Tax=uncultured Tenacibaculum sp. TaxID=174713 RepID=UPI0026231FDF|nr:hypothetical protein [uncultured Tenacibaculum sp.]
MRHLIKKRKFNNIIVFFFLILFNACYLIPCELDSGLIRLNKKQNDDFFIGEYYVESFIGNSYNLNTENTYIKVSNQLIEIYNIPSRVFNFNLNREINAKANWKQVPFKENLFLSVDLIFEKQDSLENYGTSWEVYKKNGKPVILIKVGDPDECSAIRFIKK